MQISLYIPIWFYFNPTCEINHPRANNLYIPIWFYFNQFFLSIKRIDSILYIPIWFYFNRFRQLYESISVGFTFQYGSTLISSNQTIPIYPNSFTFQYGSTLISILLSICHHCMNLHSNMVLL